MDRITRDRCTFEGTKWVAEPLDTISAPSNLAPVSPMYSPVHTHTLYLISDPYTTEKEKINDLYNF